MINRKTISTLVMTIVSVASVLVFQNCSNSSKTVAFDKGLTPSSSQFLTNSATRANAVAADVGVGVGTTSPTVGVGTMSPGVGVGTTSPTGVTDQAALIAALQIIEQILQEVQNFDTSGGSADVRQLQQDVTQQIMNDLQQLLAALGVNTNLVLFANYSPAPAHINDLVTINVTGGTAPYTVTLTAGAGQLNGNVYTAPGSPEAATFSVSDSSGLQTTINVTINPPVVPAGALAAITVVSGNEVCPAGFQAIGGSPSVYSSQHQGLGTLLGQTSTICGEPYAEGAVDLVYDVQMEPVGQSCPADYILIGSVEVAVGPGNATNWNGTPVVQQLCVQIEARNEATQFVTKLYAAPACAAGDLTSGQFPNNAALCELH